jgi:hypothetical protein
LIVEGASVPVLVDAGVGTASDAAVAMELGCDGVLMNTAIAEAKDPVRMARAMKLAVEAGRHAYLSGRMGTRKYADPSPAGLNVVAVRRVFRSASRLADASGGLTGRHAVAFWLPRLESLIIAEYPGSITD